MSTWARLGIEDKGSVYRYGPLREEVGEDKLEPWGRLVEDVCSSWLSVTVK